jgi:signal recognition particle subunit SRP19
VRRINIFCICVCALSLIARSERQLLEMISSQIQRSKPDHIPKPPYSFESANKPVTVPTPPKSGKGKHSAAAQQKAKQPTASSSAAKKPPPGRRLPVPPEPQPPLASRVSAYSPALASGVLIETVKAGMAQESSGPGGVPGGASGPGMGGGGGGGKGKRKFVRVRG